MTRVFFYEKPGCINNTRQKQLLLAAGHELEVRNLLEEPWTADSLRPYFGNLPVSQWFNRTAPAVKSGVVDPDSVPEQEALRLMVEMPLLIRRPLMFAVGEYRVGFDVEAVNTWIGLAQADAKLDVETCQRQ
jgi:nitrogenase-associated protein